MRELFIYYRLKQASSADLAHTAVQRLQAGLCERHAGLQARLLRRRDEDDGAQTWLEIYALPTQPGGVTPDVQAAIEKAAETVATWIDGPRHCEAFEPAS